MYIANNGKLRKEKNMHNQDIKDEIRQAGLKFWMIAEKLGCNDGNFSRKLRRELPDEKKAKIRNIIAQLKSEQEGK